MNYGGFQRLSEASAYSEMRKEQIGSEAQERKEILDKCELASQKMDNGDKEAAEELYQLLNEYNNLRDKQKRKKNQ